MEEYIQEEQKTATKRRGGNSWLWSSVTRRRCEISASDAAATPIKISAKTIQRIKLTKSEYIHQEWAGHLAKLAKTKPNHTGADATQPMRKKGPEASLIAQTQVLQYLFIL